MLTFAYWLWSYFGNKGDTSAREAFRSASFCLIAVALIVGRCSSFEISDTCVSPRRCEKTWNFAADLVWKLGTLCDTPVRLRLTVQRDSFCLTPTVLLVQAMMASLLARTIKKSRRTRWSGASGAQLVTPVRMSGRSCGRRQGRYGEAL